MHRGLQAKLKTIVFVGINITIFFVFFLKPTNIYASCTKNTGIIVKCDSAQPVQCVDNSGSFYCCDKTDTSDTCKTQQQTSVATCKSGEGGDNQPCCGGQSGSCNNPSLTCTYTNGNSGAIQQVGYYCLSSDQIQKATQIGSSGPIPNPPIACGSVANPEFNSLRPYQANANCTSQTANFASFCGNDLTLKESVTETYPGNGDCTTTGNTVTCNFTATVAPHPVTIDLSGANLPIMGNTEDVLNSQSSTDTLTDSDKMNGYVSWYLNGVENHAEYGNTENTPYNAVNFSGPLQKLLPGDILDAQRIKTVNSAGTTNHDQIVVCGKSNLGPIGDWLGIGTFTPINCYNGDGTAAQGHVFRLTATTGSDGWNGALSWFNTLTNIVIHPLASLADKLAEKLPSLLRTDIDNSVSTFWNKKVPPVPWDDGTGQPFKTDLLYRKAYNEWQGKSCVIIPLANFLVCLDNVLVPNKYADLFPYIPLATTEDVKGQIKIDAVSSAPDTNTDATVSNVTFSNQTPSTLFFAHMAESSEEASLLQSTFVPEGLDQVGNPTNISSGTSCKDVEVRSNKGDNLFAKPITGNVGYTAKFSCQFNLPSQSTTNCRGNGGVCDSGETCCNGFSCVNEGQHSYCRPGNPTIQTCKKDVYISLSTTSSTPLIDDIWSRLVAGPMAIFKRIFPKTDTEGSVGQIIDIAGSTNITYSGQGISTSNTDLKIPHVGGISEYFLKGIQTALRPKGYGDSIEFAPNPVSSGSNGSINCDQSVADIAVPGLNKSEAQRMSDIWYGAGVGKNYFKECNNDVIQRAEKKGVDPLFTLAIWIHESDASNYEARSPIQDFGINVDTLAPSNDFSDQLNVFLNQPDKVYARCGQENMFTFISVFWLGHCAPVNQAETDKVNQYISDLEFIYSVMAPSRSLPNYPD